MREREEVEFAWRYRRWRALILATRGRESQGGRGELGTCLEGIQEWITSRKRDLKRTTRRRCLRIVASSKALRRGDCLFLRSQLCHTTTHGDGGVCGRGVRDSEEK